MTRKHIPEADAAPDSASSDPPRSSKKAPHARQIGVLRADDGAWEFVHPRCARARQDDLDEVETMIAAGETEIAQDELRWLLSECRDFLAAHQLLGDVALACGDLRLARGHYGYAYQLGIQAIDRAGKIDLLPSDRPANGAFFAAGKGLVNCLVQLGKCGLAREVAARLLKLDRRDLMKIGAFLGENQIKPHRREKRRR